MNISEASAYIKSMVEKNKQKLTTISNDRQMVPDIRTCLQFQGITDDANASLWVYRTGYLSQPQTTVPELTLPFVSKETGLDFLKHQEKLQVVDQGVEKITGYDSEFVDSVIADIKSGKLALV